MLREDLDPDTFARLEAELAQRQAAERPGAARRHSRTTAAAGKVGAAAESAVVRRSARLNSS